MSGNRWRSAGALAVGLVVLCGASSAAAPGVSLPDPTCAWAYQIGGSSAPAPGVGTVVRDRSEPPAPGLAARPVEEPDDLPPVTPARSAREVAAQVVAAEDALADGVGGSVLADAGHLQQLAYRELAEHRGWDGRVRHLVPRRLHRLVRDNVAARRAFRSMHPARRSELSRELPAWRIVAPAPMSVLRGHYREAERRFGVDWEYLAAINLVETAFGRIRGTSSAGAQGPMQFMPATWAAYGAGGDIRSPHDSVMAAGRYLAANGFNRPGGRPGAIHRYNNSSAYVRGVMLLAEVMARRPTAYRGYHQWQVYYLTNRGSILLPEGYATRTPIPVDDWLADHPQ